MIIVDERITGKRKVSTLKQGDCFVINDDELYMKADECYVRLQDGVCKYFTGDEPVEVVFVKVVIQ